MTETNSNHINFPETEVKGAVRYFLMPLVEFLGILVPGAIFILISSLALIVPISSLIEFVQGAPPRTADLTIEMLKIVATPNVGFLLLLAIVSYVIGHLFFRQDPKHPDFCSFRRIKRTLGDDGPVRMCEAEIAHNNERGIKNEHNMEFPYRYLYEYLNDRDMIHLAALIPWRGEDPSTYKLRTKHFLNIFKIRLEFIFPNQYLRIQRNEAHVRLMSSMWYAAHALIYAGLIGFSVGILVGVFAIIDAKSTWPIPYFSAWFIPLIVVFSAGILKRNIETFLHYQRIREIVFILEVAYYANMLYPEYQFVNKSSKHDEVSV